MEDRIQSESPQSLDAPVADESAEQQAPEFYTAPNPLRRLILPGLAVVVLGGLILGVVLPLFQDVSQRYNRFQSELKSARFITTSPPQAPPNIVPPQVPPPQIPNVQPPPPAPLSRR
jgi:hypothetical protein